MPKFSRFVAAIAALALLLTGCAVPTEQHVGDSKAGLFFNLPREWSSIDAALLTKAQSSWGSSDSGQAYLDALKWQKVYSPDAELTVEAAFGNSVTDVPVVYAAVRSLYDVESQNIAGDVLTALQDVVLPVSLAADGDGLEIISNQTYIQNGHQGVRQQLAWTVGGKRQLVDTRIVLGSNVVFIFWIRCGADARTDFETIIERALDSLTVKEPSVA
jgi:hypothetical protein